MYVMHILFIVFLLRNVLNISYFTFHYFMKLYFNKAFILVSQIYLIYVR